MSEGCDTALRRKGGMEAPDRDTPVSGVEPCYGNCTINPAWLGGSRQGQKHPVLLSCVAVKLNRLP